MKEKMEGVREWGEEYPVTIETLGHGGDSTLSDDMMKHKERLVIVAINEGGYNGTSIDTPHPTTGRQNRGKENHMKPTAAQSTGKELPERLSPVKALCVDADLLAVALAIGTATERDNYGRVDPKRIEHFGPLAAELVRRYNRYEVLMQHWRESECYCADYVAAKGSCAHCAVRAELEKNI